MENANCNELSQWVEQRIALLTPPADWEPNTAVAGARFASRIREQPRGFRRRRLIWAAATLAGGLLLLAPATRVAAQQVWQWLTVGGFEVVRVDLASLPDEAKSLSMHLLNQPAKPALAHNIEEAAHNAGFTPRLPGPGALSETVQLSTLGPMSFGTTLRTADLELALHKAGVQDLSVPKQWDGAQIILQVGSTVTAAWPQTDVTLMQGLPPKLVAPAGFDMGGFATAALRAVGMSRDAAQRFGQRIATAPAMLLGIGAEDRSAIREVRLRSGPATLIEDIGDSNRIERVELLWSVSDRVYALSGNVTAEVATRIANSVE
jgi:hypothetical protein